MERILNDGWTLADLPCGSTLADARAAQHQPIDLPHDALIGNTDDLYRPCDLWYFRTLPVTPDMTGGVILLNFGGVYMDCDVLVNSETICTHHYGYTSFHVDITAHVHPGDNEVIVYVRHRSPSGRWYTGAGIYRDVTLSVLPADHIVPDGIYATVQEQDDHWTVDITAETAGNSIVRHELLSADGICVAAGTQNAAVCRLTVTDPLLWDCDTPNLYTLRSTLPGQTVEQRIGFRTVEMTTDRGLLLNHRPVKLKGVCLHHDQGALGAAWHRKAELRRLRTMRQMGVNALRTSHYPPDRQVMDLCDELGILVDSEILDIWRRPKCEWDYARFFDACWRTDVAEWIRRDRNHPSLIMWSVGNEILDTHADASAVELTRQLAREVRLHDPDGHGAVTIGSNYMPWAGAQRCAAQLDVQGYNYCERYYEEHHAAHPDWKIYGSETASIMLSRGIYHFPMGTTILSQDDLQCSDLGNSNSSWGARSFQECIIGDLNTPFSLGQFIWTGTDYIGEPTPYHTRNSYFGMVDTAGFPKECYYRFKAIWNDAPMVHIGVSWDWNKGQLIDIPVATNAHAVTLYLNGRDMGTKTADLRDIEHSLPVWQLPFEAGELKAVAADKDGNIIGEDIRVTPGEVSALKLACEDSTLTADGQDLAFITVQAVDAMGNPVDNAVNAASVSVSGGARLMGLDNGDSDAADGYQVTARHLFSGKLLIIIASDGRAEDAVVTVQSHGLPDAGLTLPVIPAEVPEGTSCAQHLCASSPVPTDLPVRRIDLSPDGPTHLTPEHPSVTVTARLLPEDADPQQISWRVVNDSGISSPCAKLDVDGSRVTVTGIGDGSNYLRATVTNGTDHPRIISQIELYTSGFGSAQLDPYGFITGGLYTRHIGNISVGNEHGVSFAPDGVSAVVYDDVDFGSTGSDTITIPLFALNSDAYTMSLYVDDVFLAELHYQKPSIWNVYQEDTWTLPTMLKGVHSLRFQMSAKIHMRGFSFARRSRAWMTIPAADADSIYGDSFVITDGAVMQIGNNVSLRYTALDFGVASRVMLQLDCANHVENAPVVLQLTGPDGKTAVHQLSCAAGGRSVHSFPLEITGGTTDVSFVFLPGSKFDMYSLRFIKDETV